MKQADRLRSDSTHDSSSSLDPDLSRLASSLKMGVSDLSRLATSMKTGMADLTRLAASVKAGQSKRNSRDAASETAAADAPGVSPRSEQLSQTLIKVLPGTVFRCANDAHWTIEFVSDTCHELTGYQPDELIGSRKISFADLIHPADRERVWETVQKAVAEKRPYRLQYRIVVPSGGSVKEKWVRESASPAFSSSGKELALEGFIQDVTKEKELEKTVRTLRRQVNQLTMELRHQEQDIETFSYMCAHNLREPLRHLGLFSQLLEKQAGPSMPEMAKGHLDAVVRAADRMARRISDVQSLVSTTRMTLMREKVLLRQCLTAALESLAPLVERTGATIRVDPMPTVIGDPILLTRLFEHLISNALRFGGNPPQVHVTARQTAARWIFGVQDQGPGIDPRYHDRIFRPFQRLETSHSQVGNGMGLAICHSIVQRHEGKLWLWSEVGMGAHFQFVLGLSPPGAKGETVSHEVDPEEDSSE